MSDEQEGILKEAIVDRSMYYPAVSLEGLRKSTKNFNQDSL
jgi:hypothetical protein